MSSDGDKTYEADVPTGPAYTAYTLLTPDKFRGLPATAWRVKNLLPCTGVAFIYGASGSGKTFLALDMAASIAEGFSWFGHKCFRAPVVYLPLEGAMILKRTLAWERHNRRPLPNDFRMALSAPFELLSNVNVNGLAVVILEAVGPGAVIIVDTLARATAGLDENSSKDMGPAIESAEHLARLVRGLVILVHHAGKNKDAGMRGSSALFAAAETVIEVTSKAAKGAHAWRPAKLKDAESFGEQLFNLEPVNLGADSDGEAITSCAVVWDQTAGATQRDAKVKGMGGNQVVVLDALTSALGQVPVGVPYAPAGVPALTAAESKKIGVKALTDEGALKPAARYDEAIIDLSILHDITTA